jgi:hypothetical protein
MSNFTVEQILLLSAIKDHEQLKKQVHILLDNCETMHPVRVVSLRNHVNNSRNIKNTVSILWNMQLAGEGLSVKGSRYQKNMKDSSRMY